MMLSHNTTSAMFPFVPFLYFLNAFSLIVELRKVLRFYPIVSLYFKGFEFGEFYGYIVNQLQPIT